MEKSASTSLDCRVAGLPAGSGLECGSYPIVVACDEAYAMPLAVAVRSAAEANRSGRPLDVVVLTQEFSANMKRRVEASVPAGSAAFKWVQVDLSQFVGCSGVLGHTSMMTYARLLLPYVLPHNVLRALYLDSDIVVLDDLGPLWDTDLDGAVLGAVVDMDSQDNSERLGLAPDPTGVDSERQAVGLAPDYFNAGVLLIDLARWRQEQISERSIQYLEKYPHTPFSDQDALNVVCAARWKHLDSRWNLQKLDHGQYPGRLPCGLAAVVHFCGSHKPWKASSLSASERFYDERRTRTKFARTQLEKTRDVFQRTLVRLKRGLKQFEVVCAIRAHYKGLRSARWI